MPTRLARAACLTALTTAATGCPIPDLVERSDAGGSAGVATCGATPPECGSHGSTASYYSTLDNAAAVESPQIGAAGSKADVAVFSPGRCANALDVSTNASGIRIEEGGHIDYARGAIWFWFRPNTASAAQRNLLGTVVYSNAGGLRVAFTGQTLAVSMKGSTSGSGELSAQFVLPSAAASDWAHYAVLWDTTADGTSVVAYVNGCVAEAVSSPVTKLTPRTLTDDRLMVGAHGVNDPNFADGAFDEISIHLEPDVPTSP